VTEVKLEPFQIIYTTSNDADLLPSNDMNNMALLSVTRRHLTDMEFRYHPSFYSLSLFQAPRSEDMFHNGTKVAYTGMAYYYYDTDAMTDMTREQMQSMEYLCFLGANETLYVDELRNELGWNTLERALLMTSGGSMIDLVNGTMTIMMDGGSSSNSSQVSSSTAGTATMMGSETSTMMYMAAVLVPVCLIVFALLCVVAYLCKHNLHCASNNNNSDDSSVWQTNSVKARKLEIMFHHRPAQSGDDDDDGGVNRHHQPPNRKNKDSSSTTSDLSSVQILQAQRSSGGSDDIDIESVQVAINGKHNRLRRH
jgi:hypothetical protein